MSENEKNAEKAKLAGKPRKPAAKQADNPKGAEKGKAQKKAAKRLSSAEWTFPKVTLERAIDIVQAIEEKNAGRPIRAENLAPMVGFRRAADWRFLDILRSANQYGIITGSGASATVALTPIGSDIVAPSSPTQRQSALLAAFNNVELFQRVAEYYAGKRIPEDEYFANTLTREFGVPRERVPIFIEVFTANLEYLKAFSPDAAGRPIVAPAVDRPLPVEGASVPGDPESVREFLDTCFVLMPFGEWYDRYFRDIYIPATKEAGFEPLRADGLFAAGAVMDQIWAQIRKAKVLLADLTGKNPNVFYELGLAHALGKPVVFVAGDIEDVPFDVRHLRVVVYDIREPSWAEKLRREITAYLKNTRTDPDKSIPQPFRESPVELEGEAGLSLATRRRGHVKATAI